MIVRRTSLVSGHRLVSFEIAERDDRMVEVVIREFNSSWKFLEPGWSGLSFGADGSLVWWWSSRHLGVVPVGEEPQVPILAVDHDEIVSVFRVDGLWLLVCELTLRLRDDVRELARWDFPEVVVNTRWDGEVLVVSTTGFPETLIRVVDGQFVPENSE